MSAQIAAADRPSIAPGFRLQWEAAQGAHVLLYPEGMVRLNGSAGAILSRCTGELTFEQIVANLEREFARSNLGEDVARFLALAREQGWVGWQEARAVQDGA